MNVLVDCSQIRRRKAGVGIYGLNIVREMLKLDAEERKIRSDSAASAGPAEGTRSGIMNLWLLVQEDDDDFDLHHEGLKIVRVPSSVFRIMPLRLLLEQVYIPWLVRREKIDVVHSLHYSLPLLVRRARKVVTIHDLTSFKMPEVHTRGKLAYFHIFLPAAARYADGLLFISEATRIDWGHYFPKTRARQFVVPLGKSDMFVPDPPAARVTEVLSRYGLRLPYLLYVGTLEPRKNLPRVVRAFAQMASDFPEHTLVFAGMKGWMYEEIFATIQDLGLASRVLFPGYIAEEDKPCLIAAAEVFLYPSLYEGFGIPLLEALACGTPTITSGISSMPEVAGDAALLVDPLSVDDIAAKMRQLLTDANLRAELHVRGVAQAATFQWSRTARQTMAAYRSLV